MIQASCNNFEPAPLLYIWDHRSLSFSGNGQLAPHHHGAAELIVALDKPFESDLGQERRHTARSLLIPPNVRHQNSHRDHICPILYLDAEGRDYAQLTASMATIDGVYRDFTFESRAREVLKRILAEQPSADVCYDMIHRAIFCDTTAGRISLDPRIAAVLKIIRGDPLTNYSADVLAERVGLSTDRMLHLFSEQVGVPVRTYRAWYRLKLASKLRFEGRSLTEAAHQAGFTDSSHYTKTFRKYYGATPRDMLSHPARGAVFFG